MRLTPHLSGWTYIIRRQRISSYSSQIVRGGARLGRCDVTQEHRPCISSDVPVRARAVSRARVPRDLHCLHEVAQGLPSHPVPLCGTASFCNRRSGSYLHLTGPEGHFTFSHMHSVRIPTSVSLRTDFNIIHLFTRDFPSGIFTSGFPIEISSRTSCYIPGLSYSGFDRPVQTVQLLTVQFSPALS